MNNRLFRDRCYLPVFLIGKSDLLVGSRRQTLHLVPCLSHDILEGIMRWSATMYIRHLFHPADCPSIHIFNAREDIKCLCCGSCSLDAGGWDGGKMWRNL